MIYVWQSQSGLEMAQHRDLVVRLTDVWKNKNELIYGSVPLDWNSRPTQLSSSGKVLHAHTYTHTKSSFLFSSSVSLLVSLFYFPLPCFLQNLYPAEWESMRITLFYCAYIFWSFFFFSSKSNIVFLPFEVPFTLSLTLLTPMLCGDFLGWQKYAMIYNIFKYWFQLSDFRHPGVLDFQNIKEIIVLLISKAGSCGRKKIDI